MSAADEREQRAWQQVREATGEGLVDHLLDYLQDFPTGAHNREAAERLEMLVNARCESDPGWASVVRCSLRALREPHLPPVRANTWVGVRGDQPRRERQTWRPTT